MLLAMLTYDISSFPWLFQDLSFSLKRALGITQAKQRIARETGIPTSKAGLERKIGNSILKALIKRN